MNDAAIKNFCIWARNALRQQVEQLLFKWEIGENADAFEAVIGGKPLSKNEQNQRAELVGRIKEIGQEQLIETAAYTWFNRFIAIRYMEANDLLPSHTRMFSEADGTFGSLAVKDALNLEIEGLDRQHVLELAQSGNDEDLFRCLFLAECNELADCLPDVFERIGSAMELLLPTGLLRQGSVIERLVDDIPEDDWCHGVEIVGWMYQYYVSERKDEIFADFKKGKKAERTDIAPATQLFTPDWIVRYMTDNSLGRLWMQAHPKSSLPEQMPYYVPDEESTVDQEHASLDPESITVIDPACGSGHILVYAFRLLASMYEETGYARRDIPRLILEKNLTGCEIDPRAAQLAAFALTMTACEWDSRFLRRDKKIRANIFCLRPIEISSTELELMPYLADRAKLLDAMAHAEECGSLFIPESEDIEALKKAAYELDGRMAGGDLLAYAPNYAVEIMMKNCEPLAKTYDVVIANPPYMGSKNMNKWLSDWTKKNYPDSSRDLCTCFIERIFTFASFCGLAGLATSNSWMFISSFEELREKVINESVIRTLVQLSVHGFKGVAAQVCTFVIQKESNPNVRGGFIRLNDFDHHSLQESKTLEAIANPDCGWFYRRNSDSFKAIPGSPIAYWASEKQIKAFSGMRPLSDIAYGCNGMTTGENDRFLRLWHEVSRKDIGFSLESREEAVCSGKKWFPYNKGGDYRKWYGNRDFVINWADDGCQVRDYGHLVPRSMGYMFKPGVTWSKISSGRIAFRIEKPGRMFDVAGLTLFPDETANLELIAAFGNSSVAASFLGFLSPTLNYEVGNVVKLPIDESFLDESVKSLAEECFEKSRQDLSSHETASGFEGHPLV